MPENEMKLLSEIIIRVKRGFLPHFINELYKSACELKAISAREKFDDADLFLAEVLYDDTARFRGMMEKIGKHPENFTLESVRNVLEDSIVGGLISVSGKMKIESRSDYEMMLQGAADLIIQKIHGGKRGADYSGMSGNVGIINCLKEREERDAAHVMTLHAMAERDCVVLNRFRGLNAFPLAARFNHFEDLIKMLKGIQETFAVIRIMSLEEANDAEMVSYLNSELARPVLYREYDEIPLLLAYVMMHIAGKKKLAYDECNAGFIGIDLGALRLTRLFSSMGFARVLGCDNNEKLMMNFEREGGLATTQENIFSNTDVVVLFKNHFTIDDLAKIRPGQVIISLIDDEEIDSEIISRKGIRDFIHGKWADLSFIFPGLVTLLMSGRVRSLSDADLLEIAAVMAREKKDSLLPDLFGDIHDRIAGALGGG
jgi:hypothetical protein